jgi:tetratricopeptide (TPR) repeat protein
MRGGLVYTALLVEAGKPAEALRHLQDIVGQFEQTLGPADPRLPQYYAALAQCYCTAEQYDDALSVARLALDLAPDVPANHGLRIALRQFVSGGLDNDGPPGEYSGAPLQSWHYKPVTAAA